MTDLSRFAFVADALAGENVFRPVVSHDAEGRPQQLSGSTVLVAHPREKAAKFAYRNALAWYENHLRAACQRFVGYLAKKPPLREISNPLLEAFAEDCNWRGDTLDVFWQGFMVEAKARGSMLLLVEGPPEAQSTLGAQLDARAFPYLVPIKPESVLKFETDWRGRIALIEIRATWAGKPAVKGWDAEKWYVRSDDKIVESGEHGLGACPVLAFSESGDFPHIGDFAQIADLSRRLVNAWSELTELQRQQGFAVMHYHVPIEQHDFNAAQIAEEIGTNNMLIHRGDAPGFIAPPEGPAAAYFEEIAKLEAAIARIGLAVEIPKEQSQAESGLALTIRFQALNGALTAFARRMEDFERRVWEMVCRWLTLPVERVTLRWAKDYALADLKAELDALSAMQMAGFPPEAIRLQQKQAAALIFASAPPEDAQAAIEAIENGSAEPALDSSRPQVDAGDTALPVAQPIAPPAPASIDMTAVAEAIASLKPPVVNTKVEIQAGAIQLTLPEPAAAQAPAPQASPTLVVNQGSAARIIDLQRDESGQVVGASVRDAA